MKARVLLSIKPKWCEMIASGKKTIEVRKSRPKIETPFRCYIYCTKPSFPHEDFLVFDAGKNKVKAFYGGGTVIGEFVCDLIFPLSFYASDASFFDTEPPLPVPGTCLTDKEIAEYLGNGKTGYGWHISDLVIYDEPNNLSEFYRWYDGETDIRPCENGKKCDHIIFDYSEDHEACGIDYDGENCPFLKVSRPPQSWMYVFK